MTRGKRIYVLDTNVLMHDPTALFKFEEHDVYLPMQVIEELDNGKKGMTEASRNARQVSRFLNELVQASGLDNLPRAFRCSGRRACSCAASRALACCASRPAISTRARVLARSSRTTPSSARSWR